MRFKKMFIGILALTLILTACAKEAIPEPVVNESQSIVTEASSSIMESIPSESVTEFESAPVEAFENANDWYSELAIESPTYSEEAMSEITALYSNLITWYLTGNFETADSLCPSWKNQATESKYQSEAPEGYIAVDYYNELNYNESRYEDVSLLSIAQASDTIFASEEVIEVPFYTDHCFVKPLEYEKLYVAGIDSVDFTNCKATSCTLYTYVSTSETLDDIYAVKIKLENIDGWSCMYCDSVNDMQKLTNTKKLDELMLSKEWLIYE